MKSTKRDPKRNYGIISGGDTQKALYGAKISVKNAVYQRATETLEIGRWNDD